MLPTFRTGRAFAHAAEQPSKSVWPKILMAAIPLFLFGAVGWMAYNGEFETILETAKTWIVLNAILAGLGVLLARGHPLAIIVGAIASPITSLNPTLAAGWFAGYTQLKLASPTGKDAQDFLLLDEMSLLWKNRVGRVLLVTAMGNIGSMVGAWLAGSTIFYELLIG